MLARHTCCIQSSNFSQPPARPRLCSCAAASSTLTLPLTVRRSAPNSESLPPQLCSLRLCPRTIPPPPATPASPIIMLRWINWNSSCAPRRLAAFAVHHCTHRLTGAGNISYMTPQRIRTFALAPPRIPFSPGYCLSNCKCARLLSADFCRLRHETSAFNSSSTHRSGSRIRNHSALKSPGQYPYLASSFPRALHVMRRKAGR
ncbi:hypothetical protein B0J12DRAFT_37726 [Macrophomina phaseolina]|uniref:Uncharacterized protein n=1 Tax=Macrophomina phaseolina TaxID=35725 RepID=A0ABQ8GW68_9PEZI|nr:hypothetical protein B0J12DRAFT_37726 [Macrophomina phaseolina]